MTTLATTEPASGQDEGQPPDERQQYIDGLRVLASVLEQHPGLELPATGTRMALKWNFWGDDARELMAATARAIPCEWRKDVTEESSEGVPAYFDLDGELGALKIRITAYRDAVCERVVVGTEDRPVERVITPAVTETVMERAEVVEWRCGSLLAPRPAASAGEQEAGAAA